MNRIRFLTILLFCTVILLPVTADASRRAKTEYQRCQNILEELTKYAEKLKNGGSSFPPPELRADPSTGEIPLEALIEQAVIKDIDYHKLVLPGCRYAVVPWALKGAVHQDSNVYDIYCVKHGFIEDDESKVTAESVRAYFIDKCQKNGIDQKLWQKTIDGFNPDPYNIDKMNPIQRLLARFTVAYGQIPVLLFQLLIAIAGAVLFLKRSGNWKTNFWAGVTAGAALWTGLQTIYLAVALSMGVQAMTSHGMFRGIFAIQELLCFVLFIFFIVMVFKFRKYQRPVGPVVAMVFATMPGILFSNIFTGLIGLFSFWLLLLQAEKSEQP